MGKGLSQQTPVNGDCGLELGKLLQYEIALKPKAKDWNSVRASSQPRLLTLDWKAN